MKRYAYPSSKFIYFLFFTFPGTDGTTYRGYRRSEVRPAYAENWQFQNNNICCCMY